MGNTTVKTPEQKPATPVAVEVLAKAKPEVAVTPAAKAPAAASPVKAPLVAKAKGKPVIKAEQKVSTAKVAKAKAVVKAPVVPAKAKAATAAKPETKAAAPATSKAAPKAKPAAVSKEAKEKKLAGKKPKLVRDSFTFPEADYAQLGVLKQRAMKAGHAIKKSELLRAGLTALAGMTDAALLRALDGIVKLKPGRPAK